MSWSLYLLGRDRLLQDKIAKLVKGVATTEAMHVQLLRSVTRETLRLYPAAPFITRAMPAESTIGGYFIPSGVSHILCSLWYNYAHVFVPSLKLNQMVLFKRRIFTFVLCGYCLNLIKTTICLYVYNFKFPIKNKLCMYTNNY